MRFMLDENVPVSVSDALGALGHNIEFVRDLLPAGAVDPLVAAAAEEDHRVLVSFDGDFESISPRTPNGQKARFRRLSRIWLRCSEYQAAQRLERAITFVESEFAIAQAAVDTRMHLQIGTSYIRSNR
jgi:predicted nuclease of predicted toxin-antitoxin system